MTEAGAGTGADRSDPELSLVIPCYNEAESIRNTVTRLVEAFGARRVRLELVLVDNGSTDDTGAIIDKLVAEGMPAVRETVDLNQGYGYGVLCGLQRCRGRLVGILGADGQVDAQDVVRLYDVAARARTPKLVKVRRRFRMDGFTRKIVSIAYNGVANLAYGGLRSIDLNGTPKIFPRAYLAPMALESRDWFLDAEIMIKAKQLGLDVFEMNVLAHMREGGRSNVRVGTCWEFVKNLVRWRLRRPSAPSPFPGEGGGEGR
jgi:glycosyltransferase involved in cell wall biosynthesis